MKQVVVVTGMGAMGVACARRIGNGMRLLLADNDAGRLDAAVNALSESGYDVDGCQLDLAEPASAPALATKVATQGRLRALVHTAAVSQSLAPTAERIYDVNLVGTACLLEILLPLVVPGTVGIVIASMGAQFIQLAPEVERELALAPREKLKEAVKSVPGSEDKNKAYLIAKRGNQVRVEALSLQWAARGARLVSISPGVIATAQGRLEMRQHPEVARLVENCPAQRIGTPEDIAAAIDWLMSPQASFVTGIDLRIDGGTIAAQRWGNGHASV